MSRTLLGLDIRHDTVTAVVVQAGMKQRHIEACKSVSFSREADEEGGLGEALARIGEEIELSGAVSAVSLPADRISYRNLEVPFRDERKIAQILPFEMEPAMAGGIEEMAVDFMPVRLAESSEILAGAVDKQLLEDSLAALIANGIDPVVITAGALPTALSIARMATTPERTVLVDSDETHHTLYLIESGRIALIRPLHRGKTPQADIHALGNNILRTITSYEELREIPFEPDMVLLTGYGIDVPAAEKRVSEFLELPVERIDCVAVPNDLEPVVSLEEWNPCRTQNARALALTELEGWDCLNFRKRGRSLKRQWRDYREQFIATGVLVAVVLALFLGGYLYAGRSLKDRQAQLDQELTTLFKKTFPEVTNIVDPVHQMKTRIEEMRQAAVGAPSVSGGHRAIDVLYAVSSGIGNETDVELTRLVISPDSVLVDGDTAGFEEVDRIKNQLEQNEIFSAVTISSANMDKSGKRVRFKLKLQLS
ncbi:MAG: type II secretion system protein GspL [Desulfosarcinaceae bacterium]|nr:type II secretion system protein GspL [Desulfosarcinaceae bacterium]